MSAVRVVAFLALVSALSDVSIAQSRADVTGAIVDSSDVGLRGATVVVLSKPDSVIVKFAIADGSGNFKLKRVPNGEHVLQVTFVGFATHTADLTVSGAEVHLGRIVLQESISELDELIVSTDHIPMVVKRDTLEYNAAAFGARPNAMVEDLLRRLPGVEVEDDGGIKAQGEDVQNVLVDGKEFFGSDPTIATRNLPAKAVDRVQVYDKQSDMAEFTGVEDGEEEKTINLQLTEEAKQGYFGQLSGGYGDIERYDGQANINRFTPTSQLSVLANVNNVNRQGFAVSDYIGFMGGMQALNDGIRLPGGIQLGTDINDGFSETLAIGLNASRDFGSRTSIRSSYFLSSIDNRQDRAVQQQQLLGAAVASRVNDESLQSSDNRTHRFNLFAKHELSDGHDLRLRGDLTASNSSLANDGDRMTLTPAGLIQNASDTGYDSKGDDLGGNVTLTYRKRLHASGTALVGEARVDLNDTDVEGNLDSATGLYDAGDLVTYEEIVQSQRQLGNTVRQTQELSLSQPLGGQQLIELRAERREIAEDQDKSVYDVVEGAPQLNALLSSGFDRTYTYYRGGLHYRRNRDRVSFGVGADVQSSTLEGLVLDSGDRTESGYTHVLPTANFSLEFRPGMSLNLRYRASTREPSMTELQPFVDNSDPLNIYVGNPALRPEVRHGLNLHYMFFDQFSFVNLFAFATVAYTKDKIVRSRTIDDQFLQEITSVNSDGDWTANGNVVFGTPIRPLGLKLNLSNRGMYSRGIEFVNEVENRTRIYRHTVEARLENRVKDLFDVGAGARYSFNDVRYSLNERLNQQYVNRTYFGEATVYLGETWEVSSKLNYRMYSAEVFGAQDDVALWEASISKTFLDQRAEVQLVGLDLLDQNVGVNFSNSTTYIQEERIASLGRYVLFKVIYHLSAFGRGKGRAMDVQVTRHD